MSQEEIKKLQIENKKLADLLEAKADVFSIGIHQAKTSLSALKWILQMFLNGDLGQLTLEQKNLLIKASENNEQAIEIINDLLSLNRKNTLQEKKWEVSKINLIDIVEDCIFDFSGEAQAHDLEIIFLKPKESNLWVLGNKNKLRIIIQNLLENAIKYSQENGKIFISLAEEENEIKFSIKDTGIGISEVSKNKIFSKFYRDPRAIEKDAFGSGIGLFAIKKIIEEYQGKIWFLSEERNGTTFYFTLPKA